MNGRIPSLDTGESETRSLWLVRVKASVIEQRLKTTAVHVYFYFKTALSKTTIKNSLIYIEI